MRTQSFFHADFAGALGDGDQHDVHEADATDTEREQADEAEENFDSGRDDLQVEEISKDVEHENGALIFGVEVVVESHRLPHGFDDFGVVAFVFHDDRGEVVGVGQVAHGAVGHVDVLVDVVVAVLNLMFHHADDLVGNSVEAESLSNGVLAGEKLFLRIGTDDGDAGVGEIVGLAEECAFGDVEAAHVSVRSVDAAHAVSGAARAEGGEALFGHFGRNTLEQRNFAADVIEIVDGEANLGSGFGASSLEFSAAGENEDQVGAEGTEGGPESALEAGTVGEKQDDGSDAPGHAQHGEQSAAAIVAQGSVGLFG